MASRGCLRNCPEGECHCAEPTLAEGYGLCDGCGAADDCYCHEGDY